jgi:putative aldouronate transport system permease protein
MRYAILCGNKRWEKTHMKIRACLRAVRKEYSLYLIFLIPLIWYIVFMYTPMYGLQIAFKHYNTRLGILGSPWVGFQYFSQFFNSYYFGSLLANTLILNVYQMAVGFPIPILLALIINEIRVRPLKKAVQNITYIPYFLSVVVVVSMLNLFSNPTYGIFNQIGALLGAAPIDYFAKEEYFRSMYVFSNVWQNMGFNSVIYIAALSAIDPQLYEAAEIDGASRLQKIIHVSIPCIMPTIVILFVMRIGSLMNVGFEKVLLMQNTVNMGTSDVISTFIYRNGIQKGQFSYSAAAGIFNSLINLFLLLGANSLTRKMGDNSLW